MINRKDIIIFLIITLFAIYSGCSDGSLFDISRGKYIYDLNDLKDMKDEDHDHYILMNDIDASATENWNGGLGFSSLGHFRGTFDGNNRVIRNLKIKDSRGLFEVVHDEIKDLALENVTGYLTDSNEGVISNCSTTGTVDYSENNPYEIGGLVGRNNGTIENCWSTTNIVTDFPDEAVSLGGLAGANYNAGYINNCYSTGSVTAIDGAVGGFAGTNSGYISNSYSTGSVNCNDGQIGGFIGSQSGSEFTGVYNCYCTGTVSVNLTSGGTIEYIGGFIGYVYIPDADLVISNCYTMSTVSMSGTVENQDYVGGFCAYIGGEQGDLDLTYCYSAGAYNVTGTPVEGGMIGGVEASTDVTYVACYWNSDIFVLADGVGNPTGNPSGMNRSGTGNMQLQGTYTDWDFDMTWSISPSVNGGFPYFTQLPPTVK